jgi:peptide/nickel transport system substrate-binding protein
MDEHAVRELLGRVEAGTLSRRQFTRLLGGLGVTAPLAAQALATLGGVGRAAAQARPAFAPTRRGGGGALRLLWWQAPTLLNPHFATGTKDQDGSRVFYEPLAAYDPDGNLVPILAQDIPSLQDGSVARDGRSVTWKLKPGVAWHDGRPFTADDVVFNWEYAADSATAATTGGSYRDIERVDKLDSHTVRVVFTRPKPFWSEPFCGNRGMIVPRHLFEAYRGAKSREAPANLKPVGTGPYRILEFKPGDSIRAEINPTYHVPNRPFFDQVEMKGGGDAVSAARAVIQTGEYDFAWNMQVEDDILRRMEQGGKGRVDVAPGSSVEHLQLNQTDPNREVDGERSSVKAPHPFLTDPAVRTAMSLLVDRGSIQEQIYGRLGQATANFLNAPPRVRSGNTRWEFNVEKANQVLDAAGWKRGADGVRAKDGTRLKVLYQTSVNAPRQKTQAIVKQALTRAGFDVELKSVVASVYFSSDPGNPDTNRKFYADLQMYTTGPDAPDAQAFMERYVSWDIASKANKWQGQNVVRWRSEEFDRLWKSAETELDPVKRAGLFIRMNDLVIQNGVVVPILWRSNVSAVAGKLRGAETSAWDSDMWRLGHWYREA